MIQIATKPNSFPVLALVLAFAWLACADANAQAPPPPPTGTPTLAAGVAPPTLADVEAANKQNEKEKSANDEAMRGDDDAQAQEDAEAQGDEPAEEPNAGGLNSIVIELIQDDRVLNGELLDIGDLHIETAFGMAAIPLKKVLGIRMARTASESTTVVLHNGDMITGQVDIKSLLVRTKWGKSEVNGSNLASIFFGKGLTWESLDLLAGPRWTLAQVKPSSSESSNNRSDAPAPPASEGGEAPASSKQPERLAAQ